MSPSSHRSHALRGCSTPARRIITWWLVVALALVGGVALIGLPASLASDSAPSVATLARLDPVPDDARGQCFTPQQAVYQLLYWLQPERWQPAEASRCLDTSQLRAPVEEAPRLAEDLKRVLDARALYVLWADVPSEPDHLDTRTKERRYVLFPRELPSVEVVKVGQRWLFSAGTLDSVPSLVRETFPLDLGSIVRTLPSWLNARFLGLQIWQVAFLFALVLISLLVQRIVVWLIGVWLRRAAERVDAPWVRETVSAVSLPLGGLTMAGVLTIGIPALLFPVGLSSVALLATRALGSFSVVWMGYRLVDVAGNVMARKAALTDTKLDDQLVPLLRKSAKVVFATLGTVFVLQNLQVDVGSLLAGLGLGGLAFALAAKDTVANLFGSVMILVDKPFQVGDSIRISADLEGIVEEIGFRSTRIRTFYDSLISVPNAKVADAAIDNRGARRYRRYRTVLALTYDTPPHKITAFCDGIRNLVAALPGMRRDLDLVEFQEFGAHSLDILLYCFMEVPDWATELRVRHNLNLAVLQLARDLGVSFAFPTQTLHVDTLAAPTLRAVEAKEQATKEQATKEQAHPREEAAVASEIAAGYRPMGERLLALHQRGPLLRKGPERGDSSDN